MRSQPTARPTVERPQLILAGGRLRGAARVKHLVSSGYFRVLIPLGIVASVALMSAPIVGLSLAFLARIWVDLSWQLEFGSTNIMQIFSGAVVFMAGIYAWMYLHRTLTHPLIAPLTLYLVLMFISGSHDPSLMASASIVARQLGPLLLLILFHILFLDKQEMRERLIKWLIIFAVVPVGYAIYSDIRGSISFARMPMLGSLVGIRTSTAQRI